MRVVYGILVPELHPDYLDGLCVAITCFFLNKYCTFFSCSCLLGSCEQVEAVRARLQTPMSQPLAPAGTRWHLTAGNRRLPGKKGTPVEYFATPANRPAVVSLLLFSDF